MPPTSIQILNHLAGAKVEVKENEEVEISCRVANAKPVAKIIWYRNSVVFNPGVGGCIINSSYTHISSQPIRNEVFRMMQKTCTCEEDQKYLFSKFLSK